MGNADVKSSHLLPWVGWNSGGVSFAMEERSFSRSPLQRMPRLPATGEAFVEMTKLWWERHAAAENWKAAAEIGKLCAEKRREMAYGWENWAWALHKQGETEAAYRVLAPVLKRLKIPGPPSGRAAYCLACFCGVLDRTPEATRWLRLAYALAADKDVFRQHALLEPDLRSVWPGLPELSREAMSILE
jgi:hypothetical protein